MGVSSSHPAPFYVFSRQPWVGEFSQEIVVQTDTAGLFVFLIERHHGTVWAVGPVKVKEICRKLSYFPSVNVNSVFK